MPPLPYSCHLSPVSGSHRYYRSCRGPRSIDERITLLNFAQSPNRLLVWAVYFAFGGVLFTPAIYVFMLVPNSTDIHSLFQIPVCASGAMWCLALILCAISFVRTKYSHRGNDITIDRSGKDASLQETLTQLVTETVPNRDSMTKMGGDVKDLITGKAIEAARGVNFYMKVDGAPPPAPHDGRRLVYVTSLCVWRTQRTHLRYPPMPTASKQSPANLRPMARTRTRSALSTCSTSVQVRIPRSFPTATSCAIATPTGACWTRG